MQHQLPDNGYERIATFDIETTHYDASKGETVSIGVGVHERGQPASEAEYTTLHRSPALQEADLIREAFQELGDLGADALVSYNGTGFDFEFINDRLKLLGEEIQPAAAGEHIDLMAPRKQKADASGKKWPSLEECLSAYDHNSAETVWRGQPVTNTRFGEELGPAVLTAYQNDDQMTWQALVEAVDHYLITDLEANLALYYSDLGDEFEPHYLGTREVFDI